MPQWATFAGFTFLITAGLLILSHASRGAIDTGSDASTAATETGSDPDHPPQELSEPVITSDSRLNRHHDHNTASSTSNRSNATTAGVSSDSGQACDDDLLSTAESAHPFDMGDHTVSADDTTTAESNHTSNPHETYQESESEIHAKLSQPDLSTTALLANVTVSQGLFAMLLIIGAWIARIPISAFGIGTGPTGILVLALGTGTGIILYIGNEFGSTLGAHFGLGEGEALRSALAPETSVEWVVLLVVVLPIIAGFEELLFRGALIGVIAVGYNISPWTLAIVSSIAFALGHGAQGRIGVIVTGVFGFILAAVFIITESLLIVIIAHYFVNALEFVIHEGFNIEFYSVSDA
ncbi:CPBP family intramembrane glutamic endopeptidase [Haloquadratum walsbyi]|jgi:Predicted metal-dependent membrane protease|uniref:Putative metal-dependent membrane protease n=1 Tax=Haloquadratum walsbyi J07HQW2 TaxID=1238425 RepID=U1N0X4_9EURY|nr:type II CAAX endopeptidase family protein [Haloquadratum walsbyi]ERG96474.1 MAG: putative metal-dependent membrane protease [Haloquadratum walsbyi J07HQW2]